MDPIQLSPVGLLQSSESKRRSPPAALQQVSEHSIHCQWKRPTASRSPFAKLPYSALAYKRACREGSREKPISKHRSIWRAAVGPCTTPCAPRDRWERRQAGTRSGNEERIGICRNPGSAPADLFSFPWSFQDSCFSALAARAGYCPREAPGPAL